MTLIELLVATALTGLLLLHATRLMDAVTDAAQRVRLDEVGSTSSALNRRLFKRLVRNARPMQDSAAAFTGDDRAAQFISLCDVPRGWVHQCSVRISIENQDAGAVLFAAFDDRAIIVSHSDVTLRIRYLDERGGAWQPEWHRPTTLPAALAIIDSQDTLVVPIGPER